MPISVRPFERADADAIARLFTTHRDSPNPVDGGITGDELAREIEERGAESFLVAVDDERVIGTFGIFRSNGRRSVAEYEGFADMFFVAPGYRCSVASGLLFTEAVESLFHSGRRVLRLTVNPANSTALRLYRRVGCVSLGPGDPGEDGNVQLHNYIPLILRAVAGGLTRAELTRLGELRSFGSISERLDDHLASDALVRDGRLLLPYHLAIGETRIDALVDARAVVVVEATLIGPDGRARGLALDNPPAVPEHHEPVRVWHPEGLTLTVDPTDGTVSVGHERHDGPLVSLTWPGRPPYRAAGWRESDPRELTLAEEDGGVRISEPASSIGCLVRFQDGELVQEFTAAPDSELRLFEQVGLRTGWFDATPADGPALRGAPVGTGLAVRDCSEVVAASTVLDPHSSVSWSGDRGEPLVETSGRGAAMVHSTLLVRRLRTDGAGRCRLVTTVRPPATGDPSVGEHAVGEHAGGGRTVRDLTDEDLGAGPLGPVREILRVRAEAAGVSDWRVNGCRLLRSPFPRVRAFACNPTWRAGAWVTHEPERHGREHGMGWGRSRQTWTATGADELTSEDHTLLRVTDGPGPGSHEITVTSAQPDGEDVLWLTPLAAPGARVVLPGPHGPWSATAEGSWQRWTPSALIELRRGIWLDLAPAPGHARLVPEILVRSTPSGLLVGCVSRAGLGAGPMVWRVRAAAGPAALNTRAVAPTRTEPEAGPGTTAGRPSAAAPHAMAGGSGGSGDAGGG